MKYRYPTPASELTKEEAPYVYTKHGEWFGAIHQCERRDAGTIAFFGHEPLQHGPVADAWVKAGFVVAR